MLKTENVERRVILTAVVFVMIFFGLVAFSVKRYGIGLPTCITDVRPFQQGKVIQHSPTQYEIHYVARMWAFDPPDVTVPPGSQLDIYVNSIDVTHGFQILGTNVNLMAVPGVVNYARIKFDNPGEYHVLCHEYCGTGHQNMATVIRVSEISAPRTAESPGPSGITPTTHPGHGVVQAKGCLACHTLDGKPSVGPTFKGLFGRTEKFLDGTEAVMDEAHIRDSIKEPQQHVAQGFQAVMPKLPMSDAEIDQIVDYLKTLK